MYKCMSVFLQAPWNYDSRRKYIDIWASHSDDALKNLVSFSSGKYTIKAHVCAESETKNFSWFDICILEIYIFWMSNRNWALTCEIWSLLFKMGKLKFKNWILHEYCYTSILFVLHPARLLRTTVLLGSELLSDALCKRNITLTYWLRSNHLLDRM